MPTREETRLLNEAIFEKLASHDPLIRKEAQDAINDFTRVKMREDGFFRKIMPPLSLSNEDLDRQWDEENPVKIEELEPDSPAAISIPLATLPISVYIRGERYKVTFSRITTHRFTKDVDQLRTWHMDIRNVISDNAIKDMTAEEDTQFIRAIDTMLGTTPGAILPTSGVAQYQQLGGPVSRDTLCDMLEIMPSTPSNLETHTVLTNTLTIKQMMKFGRNEMGGDLSESIIREGWKEETFLGVRWIATIKKLLVPRLHFYMFADPKFIGKHYELEPPTMYVRREAYFIEFFAYQFTGASIGHANGLAHAVAS
jgi:hypothetical protein